MAGTTFSCPSVCVIVVVNAKKTHTHSHKNSVNAHYIQYQVLDSVFCCCLAVACKIYKIVVCQFFHPTLVETERQAIQLHYVVKKNSAV